MFFDKFVDLIPTDDEVSLVYFNCNELHLYQLMNENGVSDSVSEILIY